MVMIRASALPTLGAEASTNKSKRLGCTTCPTGGERCRTINIHEVNCLVGIIGEHYQKVALPFAQIAKNRSSDGFIDVGEDIEIDIETRECFISMFNELATDANFFEKILYRGEAVFLLHCCHNW